MIASAVPLLVVIAAIVVLAATGNLFSASPLVIAAQAAAVGLNLWARRAFTPGTFRVLAAPGSSAVIRRGPGSPTPWSMTAASEAYIAQMVRAVVGIEIRITRMVGKSKLSQNRDHRDRVGAAEELRKRDERVIADAMRKIT